MCVNVLIAHILGVIKASRVSTIHWAELVILVLFWTYIEKERVNDVAIGLLPIQMHLILWDTYHLPIPLIS